MAHTLVPNATVNETAALAILERGRRDPVWFIETFMDTVLWEKQREIVRDVFRYRHVAVKSCHSSGKSFVAARIVLAYFLLYPGCKIVTTAASWIGVEKQLWGEIATAFGRLPAPMQHGLTLHKTSIAVQGDAAWWAIGLSTNEGERFQGFHAPHILVLKDEANGVRPEIWDAAESLGAGGDVHYLDIANPLEASGPFFDLFTRRRAGVVTHTISAFDTPNLKGLTIADIRAMPEHELGRSEWPMLISRIYVKSLLEKAGEESDLFRVRVLGEFPSSSADSVFPLAWVEAANRRWVEWQAAGAPGELTGVGCDVGESHDLSVLAPIFEKVKVGKLRKFAKHGPMAIAGRCLQLAVNTFATIVVDVIGVGSGVADSLLENSTSTWSVQKFVASAKSIRYDRSGKMGFVNKRAEAYWVSRELLDPQYDSEVCLPPDDDLIAELTAHKYKVVSDGKYQILAKDEVKKLLPDKRSPDSADAVVMALCAERPERRAVQKKTLKPTFTQSIADVTHVSEGRWG